AEISSARALLANRKRIRSARDLGDGGMALAAFRMAEAAGLGVTLKSAEIGVLFGEDQARYLVAIAPGDLAAFKAGAGGTKVTQIGTFGGDRVTFGTDSAPLAELSALYRRAFAETLGL
ncbi:MAG: phosphoribosylformylglycinamidine synthase II, partial [Tabrizicola sp.]|nr:phosphoribosylformylglycinamidine synthase II [Tabrizicola sp.]